MRPFWAILSLTATLGQHRAQQRPVDGSQPSITAKIMPNIRPIQNVGKSAPGHRTPQERRPDPYLDPGYSGTTPMVRVRSSVRGTYFRPFLAPQVLT